MLLGIHTPGRMQCYEVTVMVGDVVEQTFMYHHTSKQCGLVCGDIRRDHDLDATKTVALQPVSVHACPSCERDACRNEESVLLKRKRGDDAGDSESLAKRMRVDLAIAADPVQPGYVLTKVISGGQTGADEAALMAAKILGIATGGTVPAGWLSEPTRPTLREYGLVEMQPMRLSQALVRRSCINVDEADATLVFRQQPSPGTDGTIRYATTGRWRTHNSPLAGYVAKPLLVINRLGKPEVDRVKHWLRTNNIRVLNVAGHRKCNVIGSQQTFTELVRDFLVSALAQ